MRGLVPNVDCLTAALEKHGTASEAILHEHFEGWPLGQAMQLMAMGAREAAKLVVQATAGSGSPT